MLNKLQFNFLCFFILILVLLAVFIFEVFYFLPSPTGDDLWFLKLSFNICRDSQFIATNHSIFEFYSEALPWTTHGWLGQYFMAKLNFNCSIRGVFLISFFIKILTSFLVYILLKDTKLKKFYIYLIILITILVQLKLQFRPETFFILIYLMLIYSFKKDFFLISGILVALITVTQPSASIFVLLFGTIIYFKKIIKNYRNIFIGILIGSIISFYIYPFSIIEFIYGLWGHRAAILGSNTLLESGLNEHFINDVKYYYIYTNFLPFFSILFLFSYVYLIFKQKLIILTTPFIFFFGFNVPAANYYIISLIPFLLIFCIYFKDPDKQDYRFFSYLFSITLIIWTIGFSQYFLRNSFTTLKYSNEIFKTKKFLLTNINRINKFPGFSFLLDEKLKFVSFGNNVKQVEKIRDINVYAINGLKIPCEKSNSFKNNFQPIKIFSKKLFNSNSGYGIWICDN